MPSISFTRRGFLFGATAAAAYGAARAAGVESDGGRDESLSVFLSDLHIGNPDQKTAWGAQPSYQNAMLAKAVDEILAMRPLPARAVCFGDVSLWFGWSGDYEIAAATLARLEKAGIDLYVTTGNHDHREGVFKYFPRQRELTPVPGRTVSVIDLGSADLLLMDSLNEANPKEGAGNPVGGAMDDAQAEWLRAEAMRRKRPFIVGAHHAPTDLNGCRVVPDLIKSPHFIGWVQGHDHSWSNDWISENYSSRRIARKATLPSTGWWGDIGYATMRTYADRAELKLVQRDFYFPNPLKEGEQRPKLWDDIIAENRGASCTFRFG